MLFAATGCNKLLDESSMTVSMTDAPGFFTQVNIDLAEIQVKYEDNHKGDDGWISLDTKAGVYNQLDYRDGKTVAIASHNKFPLGEVLMLKVKLGTNNTVVTTGGVRAELHLPDSFREGVYINLNTTLKYNQHIKIVLDFSADDSVLIESDGTYTLAPKITVQSVVQV